MANSSQLLLAYYGDDFTGSTDALESLTRAGLRTALFLAPPTPAQLARFPGLQAVGVAGLTRSLAPDALAAELRPALGALRALEPRHVHYKVCSTFDSSPEVGSIGRAIEVGAEVLGSPFVPLVVGAPALGRYCVFGQLFARFGIGSAGAIHRLDRHPSISRHPVTPMTEADLLRHLAHQTDLPGGLVDVLALDRPEPETRAALDALVAGGAKVVLFDALRPAHLERIGAVIEPLGSAAHPLFSVGSSAVGTALGTRWAATGVIAPPSARPPAGPAAPLLVVSGSCSPVTGGQIDCALAAGFAGVALDPGELGGSPRERRDAGVPCSSLREERDPPAIPALTRRAKEEILAHLRAGRHTVVYTARGEATTAAVSAERVGATLGAIARAAVEQAGVRRVVFAGGDSSSYAARALGIEAVELREDSRTVEKPGITGANAGSALRATTYGARIARGEV